MTKPRKPSEILTRAAERVDLGWTQGVYGRKDGRQVNLERLADADCFCGVGAAFIEAGGQFHTDVHRFMDAEAQAQGFQVFAGFNDATGRTQQQVSAAMRRAAVKARRSGR